MTDATARSWGRLPAIPATRVERLHFRDQALPLARFGDSILPWGNGRSYGDSCLNAGGTLLDVSGLDRFLGFDAQTGVLRCEAGVQMGQILEVFVPRGFFLPVAPGTKFVTVGGAIANDVHGKNHHREGTFGRHVLRFELLRSDGECLVCSPTENDEMFRATIGGLGLTGLITWAEVRLRPIPSPFIAMESIRFRGVDEFLHWTRESEAGFEYVVAFVDYLARGSELGRGHLLRGNHADPREHLLRRRARRLPALSVPIETPGFLLNRHAMRLFNALYYHRQRRPRVSRVVHWDPFFHPLDALRNWNRLYGHRGFFQYQCVVPLEHDPRAIRALLRAISEAGEPCNLGVMKAFGDLPSPGLLSFPRPGVTLALDFPNHGERTLALMTRLDELVAEAGGALYPAKDARMSPEHFRRFFPQWRELEKMRDPRFSSSFWRRMTGDR